MFLYAGQLTAPLLLSLSCGVITIGQHARYGEPWAYFPHTIQSPPINAVYVNGMHIAEIGQMALSFRGSKYIANIGCHASHKEAREISPNVTCITVKNKKKDGSHLRLKLIR